MVKNRLERDAKNAQYLNFLCASTGSVHFKFDFDFF